MRLPPEVSITRLAIYLRFLEDYIKEKGTHATINSIELAQYLNINHHQIRKDLSYFGRFGERGVGYNCEELTHSIRKILGLSRRWNLCLCGAGNLGSALLAYRGFRQMRLDIIAVFDNDAKKVGKTIRGVEVYGLQSMATIIKKLNIAIGIIAVPQIAAQDISDRLIKVGIRAILNFAPVKLIVPKDVKLRNADLSTELINLTYFLSNPS